MASEGVVNRPMLSTNIFILLFEFFFLFSFLCIDVTSLFSVYYDRYLFLASALSCVESFDDGLPFHPRPLFLGILLSLVPHRLVSILNLMTRHDHGFLSRIPFDSAA